MFITFHIAFSDAPIEPHGPCYIFLLTSAYDKLAPRKNNCFDRVGKGVKINLFGNGPQDTKQGGVSSLRGGIYGDPSQPDVKLLWIRG